MTDLNSVMSSEQTPIHCKVDAQIIAFPLDSVLEMAPDTRLEPADGNVLPKSTEAQLPNAQFHRDPTERITGLRLSNKVTSPESTHSKEVHRALAHTIRKGNEAESQLADPSAGVRERRELQALVKARNEARRIFIESNHGLVASNVKQFYSKIGNMPTLDFDDIFQAGTLGLIRAVDKFDPDKGFTFATYAVSWIRSTIAYNIKQNTAYSLPRRERVVKNAIHELQKIEVSAAEICTVLDLTPEELARLTSTNPQTTIQSLDKKIGKEGGKRSLHDVVQDQNRQDDFDKILSDLDNKAQLADLLSFLDPRTRMIIEMFCGIGKHILRPHNVQEISEVMGVGVARIRQLKHCGNMTMHLASASLRFIEHGELKEEWRDEFVALPGVRSSNFRPESFRSARQVASHRTVTARQEAILLATPNLRIQGLLGSILGLQDLPERYPKLCDEGLHTGIARSLISLAP